jgi:hypothetical protein
MKKKLKTKTYKQRDNDDNLGKKTYRLKLQTDLELKKEIKEFINANQITIK